MSPKSIIMEKQVYDEVSRCLDVFMGRLSKVVALTPGAGLLTGKIGLAILLYEYAAYKGDKKTGELADHLIDTALSELNPNAGIGLAAGLNGIVWGINYLLKRGFVQADEEIFEEIDDALFKEKNKDLNLYDFGNETEKALYLLSRINFEAFSSVSIWQQRAEKYLNGVRKNMDFRNSRLYACKDLFHFFHVCEMFRSHGLFLLETELLYRKFAEIVEFFHKIEKNNSNRYVLDALLSQIPIFSCHMSVHDNWKKVTLTEVIEFYQNVLISGREISTPKAVTDALFFIVENQKRIDELLLLLNPNNAGLGNYVGGFAWAMMQWCKEQERLYHTSQSNLPIVEQ